MLHDFTFGMSFSGKFAEQQAVGKMRSYGSDRDSANSWRTPSWQRPRIDAWGGPWASHCEVAFHSESKYSPARNFRVLILYAYLPLGYWYLVKKIYSLIIIERSILRPSRVLSKRDLVWSFVFEFPPSPSTKDCNVQCVSFYPFVVSKSDSEIVFCSTRIFLRGFFTAKSLRNIHFRYTYWDPSIKRSHIRIKRLRQFQIRE